MLWLSHRKRIVSKRPFALFVFFEKREILYPRIGQHARLLVFFCSQIKFVCTNFFHCFLVRKNGKWLLFNFIPQRLNNAHSKLLVQSRYIFLPNKAHFNIYLRMLKSSVSTKIFVAEASSNLKILFKTSNH